MANKHRKVWKMVSRKPLSRKQTQPKGKTLSWKPNQIFLWPESVLRWPESVFRWPTFLMANKHRKVWKVISQKVNSENKHGLNVFRILMYKFLDQGFFEEWFNSNGWIFYCANQHDRFGFTIAAKWCQKRSPKDQWFSNEVRGTEIKFSTCNNNRV